MENDARTPDKLVDGVNDTYDASHMWLAPVFPGIVSTFEVVVSGVVSFVLQGGLARLTTPVLCGLQTGLAMTTNSKD